MGLLLASRRSPSPFAFSTGYLDLYNSLSAARSIQNSSSSRLNEASASYKVALSEIGKLKAALASFQTSARSLTGTGLGLLTANSSDTTVLAATSDNDSNDLVAGSYAVVVNTLAQGQTLSSASQSSATTAIGTGATTTISFEFGTTVGATFSPTAGQATKSITISSNNSLHGIASALNAANIGISASVTFDGTGYKLGLTSPTGIANSLKISVTGDTSLQGLLAFDPAGVMNLTQSAVAQNASLTVNGVAVSSSGNAITGAIAGVTLNLNGAGSGTVVVEPDAVGIASKITKFLAAYNTLQSTFATLGNGSRSASNLIPDARHQLATTIRSTPFGLAATPYNSLAQLGIGTDRNGNLSVDTTELQNAIIANATVATSLFANSGTGIADRLVTQIDQLIGARGKLERRSALLTQSAATTDSARAQSAATNQRQARSYARLAQSLNTYQNIYNLLVR